MTKEGKEDTGKILDRLEEEYFDLHERVDQLGKSADAEKMWELYKQMIELKRRIFDLITTTRKGENIPIDGQQKENREDNIVSRVLGGDLILKKKDIIPLAEVKFHEGRSHEAFLLFLKALEQDISDPIAIRNVAEMYLYEGYVDKWEKFMRRALSLAEQKQDMNTLFLLGYFAEECGGILLATDCYLAVMNFGPEGRDGIDMSTHIKKFLDKHLKKEEAPSSPEG
jgi:tetratricopeptide (TPR) repeat protein